MSLSAPDQDRLRRLLAEIGPKPFEEDDSDDEVLPIINEETPEMPPPAVMLADASGGLALPPMPPRGGLPMPPVPAEQLPAFQIPGMGTAAAGAGGDVSRILQAIAPSVAAPAAAPGQRPISASAPGAPGRPAAPTVLPPMPSPPGRIAAPQPPQAQYSDPLMVLGNPLTALAMIASSFTRQPLTTAMMALAAATQAQAAGDQQRFQNSYREYEMALQKANFEQQQENQEYRAALDNRRVAVQERLAEARLIATRRRDGAMNAYLDSGGNVWDLIEARLKAGKPVSAALLKTAAIKDMLAKDPNLSLAQAEQQYERDKADAKRADRRPTMGNVKAQATLERTDELMRENPAMSRAEAERRAIAEVESAARPPRQREMTGNQRVREQKNLQMIDESLLKIDAALGVLNKYRLAAGAAGRVFRGIEIVGNITGLDVETDREQFRRDVEFLKLAFPRLMSSGGRPLAGENKRADAIIGGLGLGDTTLNTIRSLEELKQMYGRLRHQQADILGKPSETPPTAAPPGAGGVDWDAFPKAQ